MAVKQLIERIEVGSGGASSIEFTNIPQDGAHLVLFLSCRSDASSERDTTVVGFNTDAWSSGNFDEIRLTTLSTGGVGSGSAGNFKIPTNGNDSTTNTFSNTSLYISNYSTTSKKSMSAEGVAEHNASLGNLIRLIAGKWDLTEAITKVTLSFPDSAEFMNGSTVSLYKITRGGDGTVTTA